MERREGEGLGKDKNNGIEEISYLPLGYSYFVKDIFMLRDWEGIGGWQDEYFIINFLSRRSSFVASRTISHWHEL